MKKKLGRFDVLALVIGSIIGWGSFTLPGKQFLAKSGVLNTTLGLIIGGVLVMIIQKVYHIMLLEHVEEGGEFTYTLKNLGRGHGFIVGWSLSLCYLSMIPLNASAYVLLFKVIFQDKFSFGYLYSIAGYPVYVTDVIIMSSVIIIFAYINIRGLKLSSKVQNFMSFLLVIIVLVLVALIAIRSDLHTFNQNYIANYNFSFAQIATVISIVPFLFVGFDVIPQVAKELKFKAHKATRLALISIFLGVLIYASLNVIAGLSFSGKEALQTNWAVADSVILKLGYIGFAFMLVALWAAITGGINGFMIASSKLIAALSEYKIMKSKYSIRNKNDAYPYAIIFVSGVSLIAPWIGREVIIYIVDMASVLAAVAYGYVSFISYNKAKNLMDKIMCILAVGVSILFILLLLVPFSPAMLSIPALIFLVLWTIFGFVIYLSQKKLKTNK